MAAIGRSVCLGGYRGQIVIHDDFDADDEEIAREFEESEIFPPHQ